MAILTNYAVPAALMAALTGQPGDETSMHSGFIDVTEAVPGIVAEPRYYGTNNFMGVRVTGYEAPKVVVSKEVGAALAAVQAELEGRGMAIKIYDGYRPQRAVDHFMRWIADPTDTKNKSDYYPNVPKGELVERGYIAEKSGHSRGGSVDLTLVQRADDGSWQELDMGTNWDMLDVRSHAITDLISESAQANRKLLADLMVKHGFRPYSEEWWHFTLDPEPHPGTYFDFPID